MAESVSITLTPELERFVDERMERWGLASREETVRSILERLMAYEAARKAEVEELRAALQPAIEQALRGEGVPLDVKDIIASGERRLAEIRAQREKSA